MCILTKLCQSDRVLKLFRNFNLTNKIGTLDGLL